MRSKASDAIRRVPKQTRQRSQWKLSTSLKSSLESHPHWPYLKPRDWHPLARVEWGLDVNIKRSDPRYNLIRNHCNNRISKNKKEHVAAALVRPES